MVNLIRNSLKFAPPNSPIRISARADDQALLVTVSNQGPPIPEEYLEHVFEKFYPIPRHRYSSEHWARTFDLQGHCRSARGQNLGCQPAAGRGLPLHLAPLLGRRPAHLTR